MLIDVHVHTDRTDGGLDLAAVAEAAKDAGLDGIAVTDRHVPLDAAQAAEVSEKVGISIFAGVEIATDRGAILAFPSSAEGGYADAEWGEPDEDGWIEFVTVSERLTEAGYALVAVQPFDTTVADGAGENIYQVGGLHGIEVAVGSGEMLAHDRALELALSRGVSAVGGSNCLDNVESLGSVATLFIADGMEQQDLAKAIRSGEVWVVESGEGATAERGRPRGRGRGRGRGGRDGGGRDGGNRDNRGPRGRGRSRRRD